jgi:hypothetical protein
MEHSSWEQRTDRGSSWDQQTDKRQQLGPADRWGAAAGTSGPMGGQQLGGPADRWSTAAGNSGQIGGGVAARNSGQLVASSWNQQDRLEGSSWEKRLVSRWMVGLCWMDGHVGGQQVDGGNFVEFSRLILGPVMEVSRWIVGL